jgi:hypothetical protein
VRNPFSLCTAFKSYVVPVHEIHFLPPLKCHRAELLARPNRKTLMRNYDPKTLKSYVGAINAVIFNQHAIGSKFSKHFPMAAVFFLSINEVMKSFSLLVELIRDLEKRPLSRLALRVNLLHVHN